MEVANTRLRLEKVGSDVPKNDVTPAECMLLHILHGPRSGGLTFGELEDGKFSKIEVTGEALVACQIPDKVEPDVLAKAAVGEVGKPGYIPATPAIKGKVLTTKAGFRARTDVEELARLRAKYGGARTKDNKPIIDTIWPNKFKPELPQTFAELNWQEIGAGGIEVGDLNYATGNLATSKL